MPAPRCFPARRGLGGTGGGARLCPKIHSRAEGGDPAAAFGLAPHQCEQRERRGAGVRRCSGLGKGGEAPERDEQRVLAVRGHGLAEEKLLRLLGWARPGQGAALCREGAPCPVTDHRLGCANVFPTPAGREAARLPVHMPRGSEVSKLPPCLSRRRRKEKGGAGALPSPKVGREPGRVDRGSRGASWQPWKHPPGSPADIYGMTQVRHEAETAPRPGQPLQWHARITPCCSRVRAARRAWGTFPSPRPRRTSLPGPR